MYRVLRTLGEAHKQVSIISVDSIISSVHLIPRIVNSLPPEGWTSFLVLESSQSFYINPFSDRDTFLLFS